MSELLLSEKEERVFDTDGLELVRLTREVRRLKTLLKNQEEIHQRALERAAEGVIPPEDRTYRAPVDLEYTELLRDMVSFLVAHELSRNNHSFASISDQTLVYNIHQAVVQWFGAVFKHGGVKEALLTLAKNIHVRAFVFNSPGTMKLGEKPDLMNSPIRKYEKDYLGK